jgi:hypothetical protein
MLSGPCRRRRLNRRVSLAQLLHEVRSIDNDIDSCGDTYFLHVLVSHSDATLMQRLGDLSPMSHRAKRNRMTTKPSR